MNVAVGGIRLKFRGLSEHPVFSGHDAVVLPFDTYHAWQREADPGQLTDVQLRTRLEILRAAAEGTTVVFLYEDCFAHYLDPRELSRRSLGAMVLGDIGLAPVALSCAEDRMDVLAREFGEYLERFGLAESAFETRHPVAGLRPLCRTGGFQLTGVAAPEGEGAILFLPGDPRNRFLEFFACLGRGIRQFRGASTAVPSYVFSDERPLVRQRELARRRLERIERRLDQFRHRRELLSMAGAEIPRLVPEWFASFLGVDLEALDEPGLFLAHNGDPGLACVILAAAQREPANVLVALEDVRAEEIQKGRLDDAAAAFLVLLNGEEEEEIHRQAEAGGVHLLLADDLLKVLDRQDREGDPGSVFRRLQEQAVKSRSSVHGRSE